MPPIGAAAALGTGVASSLIANKISTTAEVQLQADVSNFNRNINKARTDLGAVGDVFKSVMQTARVPLTGRGFIFDYSGLEPLIRSSVEEFVEFQKVFNEMRAKMIDSEALGNKQLVATKEIRDKITQVASTSKFFEKDIAETMLTMGKAGKSSKQIIETIGHAELLASSSGYELNDSMELIIGTMNSFQFPAERMNHIVNVMAAATSGAATDMPLFAKSIEESSVLAKKAGVEFEELSSAVMVLADRKLRGSAVDTALKNIMLGISGGRGRGRGQAIMQEIREALEGKGLKVNVPNVLKAIRDASKDTQHQLQILYDIFGRRAITHASILIDDLDKFVQRYDSLKKTQSGFAQKQKTVMLDGIKAQLEMKSSLDSLRLAWGERWNETLTDQFVAYKQLFDTVREFIKSGELDFLFDFIKWDLPDTVQDMVFWFKTFAKIFIYFIKAVRLSMQMIKAMLFPMLAIADGIKWVMKYKSKREEEGEDEAMRGQDSMRMAPGSGVIMPDETPTTEGGLGKSIMGLFSSASQSSEKKHIIEFKNAPEGTRMTVDTANKNESFDLGFEDMVAI